MAFYGKHDYWEERYSSSNEPYEWYQSYHGIRHLFSPFNLSAMHGLNPAKPRRILETREYVPRTESHLKNIFPDRSKSRVLILGCGNSRLGEDMIRDGWTGGVTCVDWSDVVIQQMQAKYANSAVQRLLPSTKGRKIKPGMKSSHRLLEFVCADFLQGLHFQAGSFDLIVCKGMFDALVSGAGAASNARQMNDECHRLLNSNHGALVVITHGNPENRIVHFENPGKEWWTGVGIHNIPKPHTQRRHLLDHDGSKFHYAYICRKNSKISSGSLPNSIVQPSASPLSDDENSTTLRP